MRVLVVSPHVDDETLGAAGTLLKYKSEKAELYWIIATTWWKSSLFSEERCKKRDEHLERIKQFFGFKKVYNLEFPDAGLREVDTNEALNKIIPIVKGISPDTVILPDYNDAHTDHRIVYDWLHSCTKSFRMPCIKKVMTMEIMSETNFGLPQDFFSPNYYVDITSYIDKKINALKIFDTEISEPPFPRSSECVRAQALIRGSEAGIMYAEAFRLIKAIEK